MPKFYKPGTRKNNRFFVVRGSIEGREYEITTDSTHKRDAEDCWFKFRQQVVDHSRPSTDTFADAVILYETSGNRKPSQMAFVRKIRDEIGHRRLKSIKPSEVRKLAKTMYPRCKPSTWNRNVIGPTRAVINCSADDELCSHIRIKNYTEDEVIKVHPSEGAGELLMANTEGLQRLYIAALEYQGLRPSDALSIRGEYIDMNARKFTLIVPKTGKVKTIIMDDDFWLELTKVKFGDGRIFPWANRSSIDNWFKPLMKRLDVRFGARMARHKFASDIVAEGGTTFDLVNNGSWTSERSVSTYVTLQEDRAREMLKRKKTGKKSGNAG